MSKKIGLWAVAAIAVAAFLAGAALSGWLGYRGLLGLALAHQLETTGLCANALESATTGPQDRLERLLENRLDHAVEESSRLVDQGARLAGPSPNLKDSVRRAAAYYTSAGATDKAQAAEALSARLR